MKPNGCRKLRGTLGGEKVRCAKILNPNDDACKKLWRDEGEKPGY